MAEVVFVRVQRGITFLLIRQHALPTAQAQSLPVQRRTNVFHSGGNVMEWMTVVTDRMNHLTVVLTSVDSPSCSSVLCQIQHPSTAFLHSRFVTELHSVMIRRMSRTVRHTRVLNHSSSVEDLSQDVFRQRWFAMEVRTAQMVPTKRAAQSMCARGTNSSVTTSTVFRTFGGVMATMTVEIGQMRKVRPLTARQPRALTAT